MYTHEYLTTLSATQILDLLCEFGFTHMSVMLSLNEGTREDHVKDLNLAYRLTTEDEFSFVEYCQVEQLLFTYFDLTNYQPTK